MGTKKWLKNFFESMRKELKRIRREYKDLRVWRLVETLLVQDRLDDAVELWRRTGENCDYVTRSHLEGLIGLRLLNDGQPERAVPFLRNSLDDDGHREVLAKYRHKELRDQSLFYKTLDDRGATQNLVLYGLLKSEQRDSALAEVEKFEEFEGDIDYENPEYEFSLKRLRDQLEDGTMDVATEIVAARIRRDQDRLEGQCP